MTSPCKNCGGVCCKWVSVPLQGPIERFQTDEWVAARGVLEPIGERITAWHIPSRCRRLRENGRCVWYKSRPARCKEYEPGGADCRAIRRIDREYKERKRKEDVT